MGTPAVRSVHLFQTRSRSISLGRRTALMGVLNTTPDSFSDGGRFFDREAAVEHGLEMIGEGADFIDIGGESSRPGSEPVSVSEELRRVLPVLEDIRRSTAVAISIDTTKAEVARECLAAGADLVNDISGLRFDPGLAEEVAGQGAGLVLMHMRGTPATMQHLPPSSNLFEEIREFLRIAIARAREAGVREDAILVDPGIGFGKTAEQNLELINRLSFLAGLAHPVLLGPSRKSFIGRVLSRTVEDRLWGTAAACAACVLRGAHVLRVHDVGAMRQVADLADAIAAEQIGF